MPVSVNVADQFKTKFNPISESFESSSITVLDKSKNQIKEIFSSLKELKNLPEGYKMLERNFIKMKNDSLGEQLRDEVGGSWRKVYEEGIDINGRLIKIHYFINDAGKIFNPKITQIDELKNLYIPLR